MLSRRNQRVVKNLPNGWKINLWEAGVAINIGFRGPVILPFRFTCLTLVTFSLILSGIGIARCDESPTISKKTVYLINRQDAYRCLTKGSPE